MPSDSCDIVPGVPYVVIIVRIPHEEHVMPLGDDLAVGRHRLSSLILKFPALKFITPNVSKYHHVNDVVEGHLEGDVDHVMGVGSGQDVVASWVIPE